jgi:hypothetical protein
MEGEDDPSLDRRVPPGSHPPERDFMVRGRRRPDEVVDDAAAFERLRREHMARPWPNRWPAAV